MKALARYQLILLGKQRHTGVNNLPKVVARQCRGRESNPQPADCESETLPLHHRATRVNYAVGVGLYDVNGDGVAIVRRSCTASSLRTLTASRCIRAACGRWSDSATNCD